MMDIGYIVQRVCYYMLNLEQNLPTTDDKKQAEEIEKMRKGLADFCEAGREIHEENGRIATEILCLEMAKQIIKGQKRMEANGNDHPRNRIEALEPLQCSPR